MSEFESPQSNDPLPDRQDAADELLDRLLDGARWPEPASESLERLQACWDSIISDPVAMPRRRSAGWKWWSAAAAALMAITGLAWWGLGWHTSERIARDLAIEIESSDKGQKREIVENVAPAPPRPSHDATAEQLENSEPTWRRPNAYEQVLVIAHRQSRDVKAAAHSENPNAEQTMRQTAAHSGKKSKREVAAHWKQTVSDAIETVLAAPDESSNAQLANLNAAEHRQVETLLGKHVATSEGDEQIAALRLLVPLASARSLPILRAAAVNEKLRDLVLPALLRLEDSSRLVQFALNDSGRERRRIVFATLWDRQDPDTANLVFQCVQNSPVHADAAAALVNAERPPIDWLCGVITDSPLASDRTTAAELLARLDRPEITARLIALTDHAASRQAALQGLLASSDPSARKFLASAEQDPYLVASIYNARSQQSTP